MSVNDNELIETLMKSYDALYQGNSKYLREQLIKLKQVELRELNFYQENEQGDTFVSLLAKNIEENKDLFKKMGNNLLKYIYEKIIQKYEFLYIIVKKSTKKKKKRSLKKTITVPPSNLIDFVLNCQNILLYKIF